MSLTVMAPNAFQHVLGYVGVREVRNLQRTCHDLYTACKEIDDLDYWHSVDLMSLLVDRANTASDEQLLRICHLLNGKADQFEMRGTYLFGYFCCLREMEKNGRIHSRASLPHSVLKPEYLTSELHHLRIIDMGWDWSGLAWKFACYHNMRMVRLLIEHAPNDKKESTLDSVVQMAISHNFRDILEYVREIDPMDFV
jgi:hypothetical protein